MSQTMLKWFHKDLNRLQRPRRQHDARRTFISLAVMDGASKEMLRWVTHSRPREDRFDNYATFFWKPLCEQVAKLNVRLLRAVPSEAAAALAATGHGPEGTPPDEDGTGGFGTSRGTQENDGGERGIRKRLPEAPGGNGEEWRTKNRHLRRPRQTGRRRKGLGGNARVPTYQARRA